MEGQNIRAYKGSWFRVTINLTLGIVGNYFQLLASKLILFVLSNQAFIINLLDSPDLEKEGDEASLCSTGSRGYRIKRWLGVRRSTWLLALYVAAYFSYLIGGCVLFAVLEQEVEKDVKVILCSILQFILIMPFN